MRASIDRVLRDGAPLEIVTQFELNVSGKAREVELGQVLVEGSRPTAVRSPLPVEVDRDGHVSVYVRPGTHQVVVEAVVPERIKKLGAPRPGPDFYDPQEVWVWIPDESIRSVELRGLPTVDPARTSLPDQWRGHTTFLAEPGATLELEVTRRGVTPSPNAVQLNRQMWLDVDGEGLTIRDRLTGSLEQQWRLDYAGPAELGHVNNQATDDDVLITKNPDTGNSGVELRQANLDLRADLRLESSDGALRAVGWDHDVKSLSATVNLPPGWTLFTASGADDVRGTWLASWTLWDFFFVLMVALSIGKLMGWRWTPLAIAALVVSHGHGDAPMWVWLHLVASLALLRALPDGRWRKGVHVYRTVALLVLFGVLATFAHDQVRAGLHPQVEKGAFRGGDSGGIEFDSALKTSESKFQAASSQVQQKVDFGRGKKDAAMGVSGAELSSSKYRKVDLQQIDPKAVVQTGPGLPNWSWNSWRLSWNGPVHKEHQVELWLVSPMVNRGLAFVRVALLILLALLMIAPSDMAWNKEDDENTDRGQGGKLWGKLLHSGAVLLAMMGVLVTGNDAFAEPSQATGAPTELFGQLESRLVAVQREAGWHLPGPPDALRVESVRVDGAQTSQLRRTTGGLLAVRLPPGRHTVDVAGRLANRNVVTVQFHASTRPKLVSFESSQWTVDGLSAAGVPDNSLQLTRKENAKAGSAEELQQAPELPPWYNVHRFVGLGLPWKVRTTVTRQDGSRPQLVKIPLLDGESVITDGMRVEDGQVLVDFPRGQTSVEYASELSIREQVALEAPADKPWPETWTVECSRIWRCEFSDLPPIKLVGDDGVFRPTWKPWPDEKLTVGVERPAGAEGQSSTVEKVDYRIIPGERLLQGSLALTIRASQGGWQTITLPDGAELQLTVIDSDERSLRLEDGQLDLPIRPGEHTYHINGQQPWERGVVERMPAVDIGSSAANVELRIDRSRDRWLLRTMGPEWGPAVLFWVRLVILLIIAVFLSRLEGLPLKLHEWILLLVGMSQLPYLALIPLVGWFVALKLRQANPPDNWLRFDLTQLALIGLTMAAAITLYAAVHTNLLINVDMQVMGAQSHDHMLRWYVDRSSSELATPAIVSLPLLVWRVLMLLWAFWLVSRLLQWVPWGWQAFSEQGLWRSREKATVDEEVGALEGTDDGAEEAEVDDEAEQAEEPEDAQEAADGSVEEGDEDAAELGDDESP